MADLFLPPGIRYTCIRCGECCRSLEVTMTEAEHACLAAHDWAREVAGYTPDAFFARIRRPRGKQVWRLRPEPGAGCRFLTQENLCRVHSALGAAAKPFAGRLFPFSFLVTPVGVFVGVRFNCPAVVLGKGPPLEDQRRDIERLYAEYAHTYNPPREAERVRFFGRQELAWRDVLRLEDQLLAFLLMERLDLPRRLLACRRLVRAFAAQAAGARGGQRVGVDPDAILAEVSGDLGRPRLSAMERVQMRLLAATFLGATLPSFRELPAAGRARARLGNLSRRFRIALGRGRIVLPGAGESVALGELGSVEVAPDAAATAMLQRYLVAKIASQSFFGAAFFRRSFAEGLDFLAAAYGAVLWLAAAHALCGGGRRVEAGDVAYAVQQVDYAYNYLGEFAGGRERLRGLLFWHWETAEKVLAALSIGGPLPW
jgi:hypothetical protein